jgi:hypothetical protein
MATRTEMNMMRVYEQFDDRRAAEADRTAGCFGRSSATLAMPYQVAGYAERS